MSKEWKLVPVELTEAMREAYEANSIAPIGPISKYGYRAMLDAAPVTEIQEPAAWIKPDVLATLRGDECCYAFGEQSPKGNLVPLFTRSDAGELERLRAELGECKGEYDRAVNKVDALQELSVTNILLDVVPGHDGMGREVFAKSVAEVCEKLGDFAMQSEDIQQSLTDTERRLHEVADYCATVEQRNADLEKLIAEAHAWVDHNNFGGTDAYDLRDRLAAAIKTAGAANKESAQ